MVLSSPSPPPPPPPPLRPPPCLPPLAYTYLSNSLKSSRYISAEILYNRTTQRDTPRRARVTLGRVSRNRRLVSSSSRLPASRSNRAIFTTSKFDTVSDGLALTFIRESVCKCRCAEQIPRLARRGRVCLVQNARSLSRATGKLCEPSSTPPVEGSFCETRLSSWPLALEFSAEVFPGVL